MGPAERARCDFPHQAELHLSFSVILSQFSSNSKRFPPFYLSFLGASSCRIQAPQEPFDGKVSELTVAEFPEKFGDDLRSETKMLCCAASVFKCFLMFLFCCSVLIRLVFRRASEES